jgi:hypothetical protein
VLEFIEPEKLCLFLGRCLGQFEGAVVVTDPDAEMLENPCSFAVGGWLRTCSDFPGEDGGAAGGNLAVGGWL